MSVASKNTDTSPPLDCTQPQYSPLDHVWHVVCAITEKNLLQVHQVHFACSFMSLGYELVTLTSSFMFIKFISVSHRDKRSLDKRSLGCRSGFRQKAPATLTPNSLRSLRPKGLSYRRLKLSKNRSHCRLSGWTCRLKKSHVMP